jgi:hypothetical protein
VKNSQTGQSLIKVFEDKCDEHSALFVPDPPRQDMVAKSLVKHFDYDDLLLAVDSFVKNSNGTVLVFDFALKARDLIDRAKFEENSKKRFKDIVEKTRQKMEKN